MKLGVATALALGLAFTQMAAPAAFAQEPAQFRTAAPRAFSSEDLQRYGLSADDAAQVQAYQRQGYEVRVLTPEEAAQYQAGLSNRTWWIIGGIVLVAAIVVAADN
ncbi:MAG: hypothetical protein R3C25_07080 [Hyphomonadaceae bacterium]